MRLPKSARALFALLVLCTLPLGAGAQSIDAYVGASSTRADWRDSWARNSQLQSAIAALGSSPVTALPIPILFGVSRNNIFPNFGDPRDGGARLHEGEDMMAVKGTPIVSPTAAVVLRVVTGPSEGLTVYTAAPGGERHVYMHLDRFGEGIAEGTVLAVGDLIGYVGNTGNASGGGAHLHFEIEDSSRTNIDPYPRLTAEFTPEQKIAYLNKIFGQTSDPVALSRFLAANFRATFLQYASAGIVLPPLIVGALDSTAAVPGQTPAASNLPAGDLELGSRGSAVVSLQNFLISARTGPAAVSLAGAGATGNFGPMTQAALIEYQIQKGISPASGYYGAATRALVESSGTPQPSATPPASGTGLVLSRDLTLGVSGSDVLALQKFLNAHGYIVAQSGAGSPGSETSYFGPATRSAVARFQAAHSISPAVGYVGPLTRAVLASL